LHVYVFFYLLNAYQINSKKKRSEMLIINSQVTKEPK
jgi:hypothetical protein